MTLKRKLFEFVAPESFHAVENQWERLIDKQNQII